MLTNDQGDETECTLNKSMGDSKPGKQLTHRRVGLLFGGTFSELGKWASRNLVELNEGKCKVPHVE